MAGSPAESHGRERKSEIEKGARSCSEAVLRNLGIFLSATRNNGIIKIIVKNHH